MRADNLGAVPVGENGRLVGMITDRDIVVCAVAEDWAPGDMSARDVMLPGVYFCFDDSEVEEAAKVMAQHQVRRLAV
jgi:CBS domain-containing protein